VASISLDKILLALVIGENYTLTAAVLPYNTTETVTWQTSNVAVATVANGKVTTVADGTVTITAKAGDKTATCTVTVKLGSVLTDAGVVIAGITWATRNVDTPGHFADRPADLGMFYQWNKAIGWSATDPLVNSNGGTTWSTSSATGTTWETTNNVCPAGWRVPTNAELTALASAGSTWTTTPAGRTFGTAPNQIFLPAAGYRSNSSSTLTTAGTYGNYWSSTPSSTYSYLLGFNSSGVSPGSSDNRARGFSVRCVAE
jgi:uncharacterized protein (TIGR02145 family)